MRFEKKIISKRGRVRIFICTLASLTCSASAVLATGPTTSAMIKVPTTTTISGILGCSNSSGSTITFDSSVLGNAKIGFNILFKQTFGNDKKTLDVVGDETSSVLTFTPSSFPKNGNIGVTGNPYVYFRMGSGDIKYLGRCIDPKGVKFNMSFPSAIDLSVIASGSGASCTNTGSTINVNYTNGLTGQIGTFYLTNQFVDPSQIDTSSIKQNYPVHIPPDSLTNGSFPHKSKIGGNPYIFYNLVNCTPYTGTDAATQCANNARDFELKPVAAGGNGCYPFNSSGDTCTINHSDLSKKYNPNISVQVPSLEAEFRRCNKL